MIKAGIVIDCSRFESPIRQATVNPRREPKSNPQTISNAVVVAWTLIKPALSNKTPATLSGAGSMKCGISKIMTADHQIVITRIAGTKRARVRLINHRPEPELTHHHF